MIFGSQRAKTKIQITTCWPFFVFNINPISQHKMPCSCIALLCMEAAVSADITLVSVSTLQTLNLNNTQLLWLQL